MGVEPRPGSARPAIRRRRWGLNLVVSVTAALFVALAALAGRSGTLTGVRYVDQALIEDLVRSTMASTPGAASREALDSAIARLHDPSLPHAYMGVAIWRRDDQIAANHGLLRGEPFRAIEGKAATDPRYQVRELGEDTGGAMWRMGYFRSELRYSVDSWNLLLPISQLADPYSMEVRWSSVVRRAGPPAAIAFVFVFLVFRLWEVFASRRVARIQARVERAQQAVEEAKRSEEAVRRKVREKEEELAAAASNVERAAVVDRQLHEVQIELAEETRKRTYAEKSYERLLSKSRKDHKEYAATAEDTLRAAEEEARDLKTRLDVARDELRQAVAVQQNGDHVALLRTHIEARSRPRVASLEIHAEGFAEMAALADSPKRANQMMEDIDRLLELKDLPASCEPLRSSSHKILHTKGGEIRYFLVRDRSCLRLVSAMTATEWHQGAHGRQNDVASRLDRRIDCWRPPALA